MNFLSTSLIKPQTGAEGFSYLAEPQRTKPWFDVKSGKPSASGLERWMATDVRNGKPLKSRFDYEQELMYERAFGVSIEHFMSGAMEEGIEYEPVLRTRYEAITGIKVDEAGAFYNEYFVASPDGLIGTEGGFEAKLLRDAMFMYVLLYGLPKEHYKQLQGCLYASGRIWWDYMAGNLKTGKAKIIRTYRDEPLIAKIDASVRAGILYTDSLKPEGIYDLEEKKLITNTQGTGKNSWEE